MKALIQRVSEASVSVGGHVAGEIGAGLLVFLGIGADDSSADLDLLARKLPALRIFPDPQGRMNLDIRQAGGSMLVIPQFTLFADTRKGNRPGFTGAAPPAVAIPLYEAFLARLRGDGIRVECGVFGADMKVRLLNDGPVTILLDSRDGPAQGGPE